MPSFSVNPLTFRSAKLDTAKERSLFLQRLGDLLSQIVTSPSLTGAGGGGGAGWTPITYQASALAANTSVACDNATSVNIFISISAGITLTLTHLPVGASVNVRVANSAASAQTIKFAATDPSGTAYPHIYSYSSWTAGTGETDMVGTGLSIAAGKAVMFSGGTTTGAAFGTLWASNY